MPYLNLQSLAPVWPGKIDDRPKRDDASGINFFVRHIIMTLDVIDADRFGDAGLLIQIEQVTSQVWIIDNPPEVAFEVPVIDNIKSNESAEQSPVGLDDALAK